MTTYADVFKMTDSINTINFSPAQGYAKPDELGRIINRAEDGTLYMYKKYLKRRWEIPLSLLDKVSADQFNAWQTDMTLLSFSPDMVNAPTQAFIVRITNDSRPLATMSEFTWEIVYEGNLVVQEV